MGGPAAQFKALADESSERWETQRWKNKVAAGFTVGTSFNGDQAATLQYFQILSMQHGMVWVGLDIPGGYQDGGFNRLGVQMGASAQTAGADVSSVDQTTAVHLGARVVEIARALGKPGNPGI